MNRWLRIWAVLAAVVLFGAACGNDDDDDDNGPDPSPPADTAPDDDTDDLSLSEVVQTTIGEGNSDYTITLARGDVRRALDDNDNGIADDNDNGEHAEIDGTSRWDEGTRRVMLPRDNGDDLEVVIVDQTMYVQADDNGIGNDDDGAEWMQFDLGEVDALPAGLDEEVVIALHDPAAVLQALDMAGTAGDDESGQIVDHDGSDAHYWTTMVSLDEIDDPFVAMLVDDNGDVGEGSPTVDNGGTATDPDDTDTTPGQADDSPTDPGTNGMGDDDTDPAETGTNGMDDDDTVDPGANGMGDDEVEVHVWASDDDREIVRIAYGLDTEAGAGAAGTQSGFAVIVDLDDLGNADDVETPETDETQTAQLDELQALFADVEIFDDMNGTTTTSPGTGIDDDEDDNGVLDDDQDDDDQFDDNDNS